MTLSTTDPNYWLASKHCVTRTLLSWGEGGPYIMNVKQWNENVLLKLTFVGYLMLHGDITLDQNHGDVSLCPASTCGKSKHNINKFSVFCIIWLPSSEYDTGCSTWRQNSTEHIPVILKCWNMVMKAQSTMKSKLHAFSLHGEMCSVTTGNIFWGVGARLCLSHISHCYIWSFKYCGHGYSNMAQVPLSCSTAMLT